MIVVAICIGVYILFFITSPLIAIFHELGHAFAYLILTKPEKIDIYIGSYGDSKKAINFKISNLIFHIKRSLPFIKGIGLCKSSKAETSYIRYIIILLVGPIFTVCMAAAIGFIVFNTEVHGLIKLYFFAFIIFSGISLISNLKPRTINRGSTNLETDGKQILFALKAKKSFSGYIESFKHIEKGEFEVAIDKLKCVLERVPGNEKVLRSLFDASLQIKQYDAAALYLSELEAGFELTPLEILSKGCLFSATNKHEEAILNYRTVLAIDNSNLIALNNLGYELREKGEFGEAEELLNKAVRLDPEFDHPYGNLGYIKILEGDLEAGKVLIDKCLALNIDNAFAYKYLAVYYLKMQNMSLANTNFNKAKEPDSSVDFGFYSDGINLLTQGSVDSDIETKN